MDTEDRRFYVYVIWRKYHDTGIVEPCYIGRGTGVRSTRHIPFLEKGKHDNWHLQSWFDLGDSDFDDEILEDGLTNDEANEAEIKYIIRYGRFDQGEGTLANLTDGGDGAANPSVATRAKKSAAHSGENNPFFGKTHSEESRAKISKAHTGRVHSPESRANVAASIRGRVHTEETRSKIGSAQLGEKNHNYGKPGYWKGKKLPEGTGAKISAARKGTTASAETKAKLSAVNLGESNGFFGKTHTEATRAKMRAVWAHRRACKDFEPLIFLPPAQ